MFINFWYPLAKSDTVVDRPCPVRGLGQDFVVFRDTSGEAHCLTNVCVHRGGSLAHGLVKGDCVECPYHGWQYDGQGQCMRMPAMGPDAKIPNRAKVDAYPTEEKYGMIFAFLGDLPEEERPPLQTISEWGDKGWRGTWVSWEWHANFERAVENSLDPAHNEFVHPTHGYQGERKDYQVPDITVLERDWGTGFSVVIKAPPIKTGALKNLNTEEREMYGASGHHGPNSLWNQLHFTPTNWMHQYQFVAPVDEYTTRIFLLNMRNCWLESDNDERFDERNEITAEQDQTVLERLQPVLATNARIREVHMPSDAIVVRYREWLSVWQAKGWRIDSDQVSRDRDKTAYVIPCPARRTSKGWALDPVPLMSPKLGSQKAASNAAA